MFQRIFTNLRSLILKVFLGLIALSFAVWGVGDIFRSNSDPVVAAIGKIKIRASQVIREYNIELQQLREMSGGEIDAEQARALGIVENTLQQIINRASLDHQVDAFAMSIPDTLVAREIRSSPNFRNQEGDFDRRIFDYAIAQNSMDEQTFVATLRSDIVRAHLINSLITGIEAPDIMTNAVSQFRNEKRLADFVLIDGNAFTKTATPNFQELSDFHRENEQLFTKPEYRTVTYTAIRPIDLLDEIDIDEDLVQSEYEYRINEFIIPDQIDIEMLVFPTQTDALDTLDRINQGEDFIAVGIGETGLEESDIKLGLVSRANLLPVLADAAFEMVSGDISDPIETDFGWHLLKINNVVPGRTQNFDEARDAVHQDLTVERAIDLVFELSNHFEDELAGGASLEQASRILGLPVKRVELIDVNGFTPSDEPHIDLPPIANFLETVFETEVGADPPLIEAPGNTVFKLRVDQIIAPTLQSVDDVREELVSAWELKWRDNAAAELAEEFANRASEAGFLNAAEEYALEVLTGSAFMRDGTGLDFQINMNTVKAIFELEVGQNTNVIKIGSGAYVIGVLRNIMVSDPGTTNSLASLSAELQQSLQNDILISFQSALRGRYDLKINDQLLGNLF